MSLTESEKAFLKDNGYLNLGVLLDEEILNKICSRIDGLLKAEGDEAGSELLDSPHIKHPKEAGADRLADLVNKGSVFDQFYQHPRVLAAIGFVLNGSYKLSSLNYRSAKPGDGLQKLHVDWHESVLANDYRVCNSIWLLDAFSKKNGATRMVPGSHLWGVLPDDALSDPYDTHPDEIYIEAEAGSVFIFNSHMWHGGTQNKTDQPRRAIHSYFCHRDEPQQIDQSRYITDETRARIGSAGAYILNV